jgi:hypothetical protein
VTFSFSVPLNVPEKHAQYLKRCAFVLQVECAHKKFLTQSQRRSILIFGFHRELDVGFSLFPPASTSTPLFVSEFPCGSNANGSFPPRASLNSARMRWGSSVVVLDSCAVHGERRVEASVPSVQCYTDPTKVTRAHI